MVISAVITQYTSVTDRQTEGQTLHHSKYHVMLIYITQVIIIIIIIIITDNEAYS